jgi:hypothetical protein
MRSSLIGSLVVCVLLLAACDSGGPSPPTSPGFLTGGTPYALAERSDAAPSTLASDIATFGISAVDENWDDAASTVPVVVQDMNVGINFPDTGGRLQIDIVNFAQRRDLDVPLDSSNSSYEFLDLNNFNPSIDNACPTPPPCTPTVRVVWWPTAAAVEGQEPAFFSDLTLGAVSSVTVHTIAAGQLVFSFDLTIQTQAGDVQARLRSLDPTGAFGPMTAALSGATQLLGPVAVIDPQHQFGMWYSLVVSASVDPDEEQGIEMFWVDADEIGDFECGDGSDLVNGGVPWDHVDPSQNACTYDYTGTVGSVGAQVIVKTISGEIDTGRVSFIP